MPQNQHISHLNSLQGAWMTTVWDYVYRSHTCARTLKHLWWCPAIPMTLWISHLTCKRKTQHHWQLTLCLVEPLLCAGEGSVSACATEDLQWTGRWIQVGCILQKGSQIHLKGHVPSLSIWSIYLPCVLCCSLFYNVNLMSQAGTALHFLLHLLLLFLLLGYEKEQE